MGISLEWPAASLFILQLAPADVRGGNVHPPVGGAKKLTTNGRVGIAPLQSASARGGGEGVLMHQNVLEKSGGISNPSPPVETQPASRSVEGRDGSVHPQD